MVGLRDGRQRLQAVVRRGIRSGLCQQHHKTVEELVEEADDKLFTNVMYNKQHLLHSTLPGTIGSKYHLRPRPHNFKLTAKNSSITEYDFITRMLLLTFIDIMFFSLLFYVFTFLFNMYLLLFAVILSRSTSCIYN